MSLKQAELRKWPGYTAAIWGVVFAIPSFVWATGSTFGAQSTVSPPLVKLAQDRVPWFVAVLVITGLLKVFGAVIGVGLTRPRGQWLSRAMVFCGGGAAILLTWHGGLFVVQGVLVKTGAFAVEPTELINWYLYLWGPWFLAGGLAFAGAVAQYVRHCADRRTLTRYGVVGALGALALSVAAVATGIG
ncbi:DUF3995 domain-containing protein [Amycolatopsis sp. AA4]|uniref:DUF3995 domain-containing protein n=1 Tax=Actinomycetes TaxID=1760 RepID=UPI0001B54A31|nr:MULTISPECIES: DUF3995 domain-containing protein [Actinomycetes]ATY09541.1 DUF3995 domain-containing protein [Amycolatopsis sp. AA4]EFL04893.1 predicted protein [Streptomyces sp. AA4]